MTNKDKYLKDGVDIEELSTKIIEYGIFGDTATWKQAIIEFMNKPVKPTLTEDEKVILRNIDKGYKSIYRTEQGVLCINRECLGMTFEPYSHLFQFIQPRRRI